MTAIKTAVAKTTVQAVITGALVFFVGYGFIVNGQISGEAVVGFAGMALTHYFGRQSQPDK